MYFVIINKKTGVILNTADDEAQAMIIIRDQKLHLESQGQKDPGWMIEAR